MIRTGWRRRKGDDDCPANFPSTKVETEDDYFRAKREYKKDLENKVFEKLEKDAKKTKRKKKEVGMIMICSCRFK